MLNALKTVLVVVYCASPRQQGVVPVLLDLIAIAFFAFRIFDWYKELPFLNLTVIRWLLSLSTISLLMR